MSPSPNGPPVKRLTQSASRFWEVAHHRTHVCLFWAVFWSNGSNRSSSPWQALLHSRMYRLRVGRKKPDEVPRSGSQSQIYAMAFERASCAPILTSGWFSGTIFLIRAPQSRYHTDCEIRGDQGQSSEVCWWMSQAFDARFRKLRCLCPFFAWPFATSQMAKAMSPISSAKWMTKTFLL